MRDQEEATCYKPEGLHSPSLISFLTSEPPEVCKNKILLFATPNCWYFVVEAQIN